MKFDFKEILLAALTSTAEQIEETSIEAALQSLHDAEPDVYAEVCVALNLAVAKLTPHVKGKFPQALLDGLQTAVKVSQEGNAPTT